MKKYHVYFVVLLLETWHSYSDFGWLGIRYIISELKKEPGITVSAKFIEYKNWKYQLQNLVKEEPDMVGLPALQPNLPFIQEFTSHLRKQSAKVKLSLVTRKQP